MLKMHFILKMDWHTLLADTAVDETWCWRRNFCSVGAITFLSMEPCYASTPLQKTFWANVNKSL